MFVGDSIGRNIDLNKRNDVVVCLPVGQNRSYN